ncbi:hypothetical protein HanIR_Chr15g0771041 [Helianthus annuus]|nr:hypothetical protein HanIR_Chr15g0771041 [Helianthus annuus]
MFKFFVVCVIRYLLNQLRHDLPALDESEPSLSPGPPPPPSSRSQPTTSRFEAGLVTFHSTQALMPFGCQTRLLFPGLTPNLLQPVHL